MQKTITVLLISFILAHNTRLNVGTNPPNEGLYLPDDLEATLWAESPMFYNPTNMDVDAKGRIWITEAVNYRNYNNTDTAFLHHNAGDRVMILEDTNSDGRADRSKVFVQDPDLVSPVGIAVLDNKVVVSCSPNLIVYTDDDGDDKPDRKEILLTGFGGKDHDHSLHAVYAGPDGRWYFNTGNAGPHLVTDRSGFTLRSGSMYTGGSPYNTTNNGKQVSDDGKIWVGGLALSIDQNGKNLSVFAHNFRNAYEVFPDSYGNLWQNDNDDQVVACRTTWIMEHGNAGYFSADGTRSWQADQRPGQNVFSAHWHQDDPGVMPAGDCSGAGAPTGVFLLEGNELGDNYRGMLLSADAGRNMVFGYKPSREGSGLNPGKPVKLVSSVADANERYVWNDTSHAHNREKWFRPSDVTAGTDGALYVADWYDPVVGGHQMQDKKGYGRIYRITPRGKQLTTPKIDISTIAGQIEALLSPAINVRNTGFSRLVAGGEKNIAPVAALMSHENAYVRARAIWLLSKLGKKGYDQTRALLKHKDEMLRATAYRALRQRVDNIVPLAAGMIHDPSSFVRREVIHSLAGLPYKQKEKLLIALASQFDGKDRWYLEAIGHSVEGDEERFYTALKDVLKPSPDPILWNTQMEMVAWRLHPTSAVEDLAKRASSPSLKNEERQRSITALAFVHSKSAAEKMVQLSNSKDDMVSASAKYWLAFRKENDWATLLDWKNVALNTAYEKKLAEMKVRVQMILDENQSQDERRWQTDAMLEDTLGAEMLIGLASQNKLPKDIYSYTSSKMMKHPSASIRALAAKYFQAEEIEKDEYDIGETLKLSADKIKGRATFQEKCSGCHQFNNVNAKIGPDLTGVTDKLDDTELLRAIIFPNKAIVFGYEAWLVNTRDNEAIFGFLLAENNESMTIKDISGNTHTIKKKEIVSATRQENSLMPSARQNGLTPQDLRNLLEYLKSNK